MASEGGAFLQPRARQERFFSAQDGRASINFRLLYQLIKTGDVMSTRRLRRAQNRSSQTLSGRGSLRSPLI